MKEVEVIKPKNIKFDRASGKNHIPTYHPTHVEVAILMTYCGSDKK